MQARTPSLNRVELFGCPVDALTLGESVQRVASIIESDDRVQHCALNAAGVVAMKDDQRLFDIVRSCGMVNADGQSLVWASRIFGQPLPSRVAGPDLFGELVALAEHRGWPVFLFGARSEVVEEACRSLVRDHPRLVIAGSRDGYFTEQDSPAIVREVRDSGAKMLFVALPTPMKEYWISEHIGALGVPFCMGVGGTFDIVAGVTSRAPMWMQRIGLEWLYRLLQEPGRMWQRYLVGNARFIGIVARELFR